MAPGLEIRIRYTTKDIYTRCCLCRSAFLLTYFFVFSVDFFLLFARTPRLFYLCVSYTVVELSKLFQVQQSRKLLMFFLRSCFCFTLNFCIYFSYLRPR
ncbi:hypothetical protein P691DRAFT_224617 [Macrolepiota fuliginosa MF-IS2]|uniref:Uncharacterized protein n=1 Tax=Macrolepiota fuliginosa MF-IS2 TaxID=1400762 RepID=A0A9P5XA15_9AGAR|nr:hypothetical protein P691DRAFT_224617 [Macrolepiota fuliginosa MF-IS2]